MTFVWSTLAFAWPCLFRKVPRTAVAPPSHTSAEIDVTAPEYVNTHNGPSAGDVAWVKETIGEADKTFSKYFPPPKKLTVEARNVEGITALEYWPRRLLLEIQFIKDRRKPLLLHEYGHALFHERMLRDSPVFGKLVRYLDADYEHSLAERKRLGDDEYTRTHRQGWWNRFRSWQYQRMRNLSMAYDEVFADILGGVSCNSGSCFSDYLRSAGKHPGAALRDMNQAHTPERIEQLGRKDDDPNGEIDSHALLAQARSHIWSAFTKNSGKIKDPAAFMDIVFRSCQAEIEARYGNGLWGGKLSTEEANERLMQRFDRALADYLAQNP